MALQARDDTLRHGVVRPALTRFCLMLNELGGAVGGGGSARNADVEFGPYTSVLSKATALDVAKLAGVAPATRPRRLQLPAVREKVLERQRLWPPALGGHTAAYGDLSWRAIRHVSTPERRRATRPPSGLDCPLHHPSGRDPTVPRTAGRTRNGRSPDGLGGGRASPASSGRCTSSFACIAWRPTGAIGVAKECSDA